MFGKLAYFIRKSILIDLRVSEDIFNDVIYILKILFGLKTKV